MCILHSVLFNIARAAHDNSPPKSALCSVCHGLAGQSTNPQWPNLGGQHQAYLSKQLRDLQHTELRNAPSMNPLAKSLTENEINDLAAYYAKMPIPQGNDAAKLVPRGQQLYRLGDYSNKITACIACHGPSGLGNALAMFPQLSGQHAEYTISQLQAFKNGTRNNDLNHIMRDISNRLNAEDMEAVARYIESLH